MEEEEIEVPDQKIAAPESESQKQVRQINAEQRAKIKQAILNATSIEEVDRLNRQLQTGYIPE